MKQPTEEMSARDRWLVSLIVAMLLIAFLTSIVMVIGLTLWVAVTTLAAIAELIV